MNSLSVIFSKIPVSFSDKDKKVENILIFKFSVSLYNGALNK